MKNLIVYLNTERVGSLKQDDSGLLQFSYDRTWLEKPNAMPLSRSLPLQSELFSGKKAGPTECLKRLPGRTTSPNRCPPFLRTTNGCRLQNRILTIQAVFVTHMTIYNHHKRDRRALK